MCMLTQLHVVTCCSSGLIMCKMDIFSRLVSACLTVVSDKQSNLWCIAVYVTHCEVYSHLARHMVFTGICNSPSIGQTNYPMTQGPIRKPMTHCSSSHPKETTQMMTLMRYLARVWNYLVTVIDNMVTSLHVCLGSLPHRTVLATGLSTTCMSQKQLCCIARMWLH